jgi:hypothetical protein
MVCSVKLSADRNEVCGLGVTSLEGLLEFATAATFEVKRESNMVTLSTSAGATLNTDWLGGAAKQVEVKTLDGDWVDVMAHCSVNAIPAKLVREWSDRNDRTLVEFRLTL